MSIKTKLSFLAKLLRFDTASWSALRWRLDNGDRTFRLDYPLQPDDLVVDVGGYHGDWAADMVDRYGCRVLVFEPIQANAAIIRRRFQDNPRVRVFDFGLSDSDREQEIALLDDASSLNLDSANVELIKVRDAVKFFAAEDVDAIDLIKINIEGEEYPLLEALIGSGMVNNITHLQIQFHDFVPDARQLRHRIREALAKTHSLAYDYPFVWESWSKKSPDR